MAQQTTKGAAGGRVDAKPKAAAGKRFRLGSTTGGTVSLVDPGEEVKVTAIEARNAMEDIFVRIGTEEFPETLFPVGNKNTSQEAREFATAKALKGLAEARFNVAEEKARQAGVLGDEADYVEGQTRIVWSGPSFDITAKRNRGSMTIDKDKLREVLPEFGVAQGKVEDCIEAASKPRKGATQIDVAMKS